MIRENDGVAVTLDQMREIVKDRILECFRHSNVYLLADHHACDPEEIARSVAAELRIDTCVVSGQPRFRRSRWEETGCRVRSLSYKDIVRAELTVLIHPPRWADLNAISGKVLILVSTTFWESIKICLPLFGLPMRRRWVRAVAADLHGKLSVYAPPLRPLETLVLRLDADQIEQLRDCKENYGGRVSYHRIVAFLLTLFRAVNLLRKIRHTSKRVLIVLQHADDRWTRSIPGVSRPLELLVEAWAKNPNLTLVTDTTGRRVSQFPEVLFDEQYLIQPPTSAKFLQNLLEPTAVSDMRRVYLVTCGTSLELSLLRRCMDNNGTLPSLTRGPLHLDTPVDYDSVASVLSEISIRHRFALASGRANEALRTRRRCMLAFASEGESKKMVLQSHPDAARWLLTDPMIEATLATITDALAAHLIADFAANGIEHVAELNRKLEPEQVIRSPVRNILCRATDRLDYHEQLELVFSLKRRTSPASPTLTLQEYAEKVLRGVGRVVVAAVTRHEDVVTYRAALYRHACMCKAPLLFQGTRVIRCVGGQYFLPGRSTPLADPGRISNAVPINARKAYARVEQKYLSNSTEPFRTKELLVRVARFSQHADEEGTWLRLPDGMGIVV